MNPRNWKSTNCENRSNVKNKVYIAVFISPFTIAAQGFHLFYIHSLGYHLTPVVLLEIGLWAGTACNFSLLRIIGSYILIPYSLDGKGSLDVLLWHYMQNYVLFWVSPTYKSCCENLKNLLFIILKVNNFSPHIFSDSIWNSCSYDKALKRIFSFRYVSTL